MPENESSGLIAVNKPSGITSFKLVSIIKKILQVKKAGHCGTLDPLACGLMLVLTGKATKLQDKFTKQNKVYLAQIQFGLQTDSGDLAGKIIARSDFSQLTFEKLKDICNGFTGEIEQIPPMYSALKIKGRKLYELARKGITVERQKRKITIYSIELLSFAADTAQIRVKCSSGTYIRTLAEDIGFKAGTHAVMSGLIREEIGDFRLNKAVSLKDIQDGGKSFVLKNIIALN